MLETPAKTAEIGIVAIAQGQQAEMNSRQVQRLTHCLLYKTRGSIGCITLTRRADDKQHAFGACEHGAIDLSELTQPDPSRCGLQTLRSLPCQLRGEPGLAGIRENRRGSCTRRSICQALNGYRTPAPGNQRHETAPSEYAQECGEHPALPRPCPDQLACVPDTQRNKRYGQRQQQQQIADTDALSPGRRHAHAWNAAAKAGVRRGCNPSGVRKTNSTARSCDRA